MRKKVLKAFFVQVLYLSVVIIMSSCGGGGGGGTVSDSTSSVSTAPVTSLPEPSTWSIIAVGDSITYGINHDNPDEEGYVPKLSRMLGENIINLGVPGVRSDYIADHLVENLEKYHPTHVLVLVGSNDVEVFPYDVAHYIHVMEYIINTIRAYKAIPIVGTLTPFCNDYEEEYYTKNINDRNVALHKYLELDLSVTLADFAAVFTCDMMEHHGGIHPNSWGYEVMAQIWYETLMKDPQY